MPIADSKKVQSVINIVADEVALQRESMERIKAIRDKFIAADPVLTGTPLAGGNAAILNTAINTLDTALDSAVFDALVAARVPSHRGSALDS